MGREDSVRPHLGREGFRNPGYQRAAHPRFSGGNEARQSFIQEDNMMTVKPKTRRRLAFLAGFAVYFSLLWTFWDTPVVYPLKIFVVLLHELSHALAAWATGG